MKIVCIENFSAEKKVFIKPDTALHNSDLPYFLPDFSVNCKLNFAVKISKQGKFIATEFAPKYYDFIGFGLDFSAPDLQKTLSENGLPWELARSFDGSALVGDFMEKENFLAKEFQCRVNAESWAISLENLPQKINEAIAFVSEYFTLRKGDLLFLDCEIPSHKINPSDKLEVFSAEEKIISKRFQ